MPSNAGAVWTSLEVAKLVVQTLVPISILVIGYFIAKKTRKIEEAIWRSQKTTEWRKELFDRIMPNIGTLRCAYTYVGSWRSLSPSDIISLKRQLDSEFYSYSELLTDRTVAAYEGLMEVAFEMRRGRGLQLRIRANVDMYRESPIWRDEFTERFVPAAERTRRSDFDRRYRDFTISFFADVGVVS